MEYLISGFELDEASLYTKDPRGAYHYRGGYSRAAFVSLAVGTLINLPGFLAQVGLIEKVPHPVFQQIYVSAWFVGAFVAGCCHLLLRRRM